jgi:hypothetical protein
MGTISVPMDMASVNNGLQQKIPSPAGPATGESYRLDHMHAPDEYEFAISEAQGVARPTTAMKAVL